MKMTMTTPLLLKIFLILLGTAAVVAVATIGTVEDCCCGNELATGSCCQLDKTFSGVENSCELVTSVDCAFAGIDSTTGDACPSTAVSCAADLVCPTDGVKPDEPLQEDPGHNSTEPCADRGIEDLEGCRFECRATGYYCNPWNDINLCAAEFGIIEDGCGRIATYCLCGAGANNEAGEILLSGQYTLCGKFDSSLSEEDCVDGAAALAGPLFLTLVVNAVVWSVFG